MTLNPENEISRLKDEYSPQDSAEDPEGSPQGPQNNVSLGNVWYDQVANVLYVCNGKIQGIYKWTKIS